MQHSLESAYQSNNLLKMQTEGANT